MRDLTGLGWTFVDWGVLVLVAAGESSVEWGPLVDDQGLSSWSSLLSPLLTGSLTR